MNLQPLPAVEQPTRVRYGVLGFACSLSMITYLDRVCVGTVAGHIQSEFGLNQTQMGMLFSAFTLAYAAFEVPSGWLGDMFGPRRTLIRIVVWWSIFTALTGLLYPSQTWPQLAFLCLLAVRFFFGMGEAGCYPNISRAFHNWFPFHERGFAQGCVWMAGRFAGGITPLIVLALVIETKKPTTESLPAIGASTVGLLAGQPGLGTLAATASLFPGREDLYITTHWRYTFWIFGSLGLIWCGFFWWWFRDRPEEKAGVNRAELALIRHGETPEASHFSVPWRKLLTNANLWMLCLMYFCAAYGWYLNITFLPRYLETMFGLTKGAKWSAEFWQFSLMAGAPLLFGCVACLCGGMLTDRFIRRTGNRKWGRRLFGILGHSTCAICYFLSIFGQFANNAWLFVLAISLASFCNDLTMGAAWASCLDIGKRYSGIVAGCMNTVGNLGGAAATVVTGRILDMTAGDSASPRNYLGWTINLGIFGGVYVIATFLWFRFDASKPVAADEPATETGLPKNNGV
jgi:ACS family glucarate transporter-like MFS transporter